ncbi:hypothetical protein NEUTE1DRAFT_110545 [Neurospora tetrasperma FGSC 2508]|uniref:Uncharacterized protein n=1 Tax=Neurospora tetrasperma (strain FGSC 2508 / ATCC MYA-4615 / P0657) TaxID=510951 RepID=F8MLL8_NEUT8|nr:uncharacterized protein NEUTE1DRAFT_110545 [Neurospora tetrasperma FGSC 2508]EGO58437.1 hypothetical protein NEUTE1DRAFT_110545 [Neurospora tetrasperma FGSC 2508]EGZ71229.1 hypothetical protein NEUTE2DRAFT_63623 [Neurospora tetrasperma FGSC 2509]
MLSAPAGTAPLHGPNKSAFAALKSTLWPERTFASFVDGKEIEFCLDIEMVLTRQNEGIDNSVYCTPTAIGASSAKGGGVLIDARLAFLIGDPCAMRGAPGRADSPTVSWTWGRCSKPAESEEETNGLFHELDIDFTALVRYLPNSLNSSTPGHTSERDNNIRATTTSAAF